MPADPAVPGSGSHGRAYRSFLPHTGSAAPGSYGCRGLLPPAATGQMPGRTDPASAPAPADNKNEEGKQSKKYIIETDDSSLIKLPAGYSTDDFNEKKVLDYINGKNPEQWETKCENGKLSVYQIFVRNIDYIS